MHGYCTPHEATAMSRLLRHDPWIAPDEVVHNLRTPTRASRPLTATQVASLIRQVMRAP